MQLRNGITQEQHRGVPASKSRLARTDFHLEGFWLHLARGAWLGFRRHTEFCVTVQSRKAWSLIWTGSNILSLHAITQNSVWHLFSQTNMQTRNDRSPSKISKLSKYLVWQSTLLGMNMEKNGGQQCEEPKPPPAAPMEAAPS